MKGLITALFLAVFTCSNLYAVEAIHGMVIFGKENLYAYHLPMFHKIHNKQLVFSFEVPAEIKEQIKNLEDQQYLTFVPAPFDLDKFIASPFSLTGDLYSGHFEKEGTVVLSGITLTNPKIVFLQELTQPSSTYHPVNYQVIGTKNDTYALHLIDGSAAIDQIFKLTTTVANDFETAVNYHYLSSYESLKLQSEYSITSPPGKCPSRLCGDPGYTLATFKIDSLYFTDSVM